MTMALVVPIAGSIQVNALTVFLRVLMFAQNLKRMSDQWDASSLIKYFFQLLCKAVGGFVDAGDGLCLIF